MFFLRLFIPVANLAGTVKGKPVAAVRSEEPHFFSGKQCGAVNEVA